MIITRRLYPNGERFKSQYGEVNYQVWCEKEVERMAGKGIRAEIVPKDEEGRICLRTLNTQEP